MTAQNPGVGAEWAKAELQNLFTDRALVPDPYPLLKWLRENTPLPVCNGLRFATRYDDVVALYRHNDLSRHTAAVAEAQAHSPADADETVRRAEDAQVSMLINQDEPAHIRIRRILEEAFRPSSVNAWLSRVEAITSRLIDRVIGLQEFDLRTALGYPLPEEVICELLGVPLSDHALWSKWSETVVGSSRTGTPTAEHAKEVSDANRNYYLYLQELVRSRRANLGSDLVSVLIRAESEGDRLTELELIGTIQMLISAGHETTANLITNGMYCLLSNPEQYEKLRANPSLVPNAVEEMLRFESPAHWSLPRVAVTDIKVGNETIAAGCPVMMAINSANRDPSVFPEPDKFDIERRQNRHIAFAAGPHFCLGSMLARQEAQAMFRAIVTRLPRLELVEKPKWRSSFVRAMESLKVRVAT